MKHTCRAYTDSTQAAYIHSTRAAYIAQTQHTYVAYTDSTRAGYIAAYIAHTYLHRCTLAACNLPSDTQMPNLTLTRTLQAFERIFNKIPCISGALLVKDPLLHAYEQAPAQTTHLAAIVSLPPNPAFPDLLSLDALPPSQQVCLCV
jgi:hypothetical protein